MVNDPSYHHIFLKKDQYLKSIAIKLPIGEFTGNHTQLVKWMFTAALVELVKGRWETLQNSEYETH